MSEAFDPSDAFDPQRDLVIPRRRPHALFDGDELDVAVLLVRRHSYPGRTAVADSMTYTRHLLRQTWLQHALAGAE